MNEFDRLLDDHINELKENGYKENEEGPVDEYDRLADQYEIDHDEWDRNTDTEIGRLGDLKDELRELIDAYITGLLTQHNIQTSNHNFDTVNLELFDADDVACDRFVEPQEPKRVEREEPELELRPVVAQKIKSLETRWSKMKKENVFIHKDKDKDYIKKIKTFFKAEDVI